MTEEFGVRVKENEPFIIYLDTNKSGKLTKNHVKVRFQENFCYTSQDNLLLLHSWNSWSGVNLQVFEDSEDQEALGGWRIYIEIFPQQQQQNMLTIKLFTYSDNTKLSEELSCPWR